MDLERYGKVTRQGIARARLTLCSSCCISAAAGTHPTATNKTTPVVAHPMLAGCVVSYDGRQLVSDARARM